MTTYTDDQFRRLPKWAQSEIDRLRRDVESLEAKASAGPDDSDTFLEDYGNDVTTPLGKRARIRFELEPGGVRGIGTITAIITEHNGVRQLNVSAEHGGLVVRPCATNDIVLEAPGR